LKVLILAVDEEAKILFDFLRNKEIYTELVWNYDSFRAAIQKKHFDACILDAGFAFGEEQNLEQVILELKNSFGIDRVYVMSYLDSSNLDLPLHEDGHLYKPLTKKDLEIFYRVLLKDEKKELVCIFFGLRFYASPERAKLLKARVENFLLKQFESEGLVGIDVHYPPVDLTPTITKSLRARKRKDIKDKD
jgi:DNA-binding response OmpR family regulator